MGLEVSIRDDIVNEVLGVPNLSNVPYMVHDIDSNNSWLDRIFLVQKNISSIAWVIPKRPSLAQISKRRLGSG